MISVDSSGWIERLTSGPKAEAYNEVMDAIPRDEILTCSFTVYEVYRKIKKTRGEDTALDALFVMMQTRVIQLDESIAVEAADFSLQFGLHAADAIVYATARHHGAVLYTSDLDLRGLEGVVYV